VKRLAASKEAFETCAWLNTLCNKIFSSTPSLEEEHPLFPNREKLLQSISSFVREAIESKLQDYQRESWLFLRSLNLTSFSFGEQLPLVSKIKLYSRNPQQQVCLIVDIDYSGGAHADLHASVAMNIRDLSVTLKTRPAHFKAVFKFESSPTPRISTLVTEFPGFDLKMSMRGALMNRVNRMLKNIILSFMRQRLVYPNYMTLLFVSDPENIVQIASAKQFQSQIRLRILSVAVDLDNPNILPPKEGQLFFTEDQIKVLCSVAFGPTQSRTEVLPLSQSRWNSIHSFTVFNGLPTTPQEVVISVYQVVEGDATNFNLLGTTSVPYPTMIAGLLDVRQLHFLHDEASFVTAEMYLHQMEDNGLDDAHWIFWNCARPAVKLGSSKDAVPIDQMTSWDTVKYVIASLTGPEEYPTQLADDLLNRADAVSDSGSFDTGRTETAMKTSLLDFVAEQLDSTIQLVQYRVLSALLASQDSATEPEAVAKINELLKLARSVKAILVAFKLEVSEYASRAEIKNGSVLTQLSLRDQNRHQARLLQPIIRSFLPASMNAVRELKRRAYAEMADPTLEPENLHRLEQILDDLQTQIQLNAEQLATGASAESLSSCDESAGGASSAASSTFLSDLSRVSLPDRIEVCCSLGLGMVRLEADTDNGLKIVSLSTPSPNTLDKEGLLFALKSTDRALLKRLNLASPTLLKDRTFIERVWEVRLIADRLLTLTLLGHSRYFPAFIFALSAIDEVALIKSRGAFHLGGRAEGAREGQAVDSNGVLRLRFRDNGEFFDLLGDARNCDVWFSLLSGKIVSESRTTNEFPWTDVERLWLLPTHTPAFQNQYALALTAQGQTFIFGSFLEGAELHTCYCQLKLMLAKKTGNTRSKSLHAASSNSLALRHGTAALDSPDMCDASAGSLSLSLSPSTWSSAWRDPLESRHKFDRISMRRTGSSIQSASYSSSTLLKMSSIDSLLQVSKPLNGSSASVSASSSGLSEQESRIPDWVRELIEDAEVMESFECAMNETIGRLIITAKFVCFWSRATRPIASIPKEPKTSSHSLFSPGTAPATPISGSSALSVSRMAVLNALIAFTDFKSLNLQRAWLPGYDCIQLKLKNELGNGAVAGNSRITANSLYVQLNRFYNQEQLEICHRALRARYNQ
jgi:hypothetical protein